MSDFVKTPNAARAYEVCQATLAARKYSRVGQIIGKPGVGKTAITEWLADELDGVRIECWEGMNAKSLMQELARAFNERGISIEEQGTSNTIFARLKAACSGMLILVDEANHLPWAMLEKLRALSDLGGAGVVLCGTDLLSRRFNDGRVEIYLRQLASRIGAKRVVIDKIRTEAEMLNYVLAPRFGSITKKTAHRFRVDCGGNWRTALELADTCERMMQANEIEKLDHTVVETAAALMAGHA